MRLRAVDLVAVDFFVLDLRDRVAAAFLAASLRFVAARLRVEAAFFAALLRVPAPPTFRRFSIVSAALRKSLTTRCATLSALARASGLRVSRSERAFATLLRRPDDRSDEKKSVLLFFAMSWNLP